MSRFLPKLFLRRAETDISTVSRLQAGKFLPSGIQDLPTQRCLQLCPQIVSNYSEGGGETQSLYFAFKRGLEGIHNQGGSALHCGSSRELEWSLCGVEGQYCPRAWMAPNIPHFNYLPIVHPNKGGRGTCGVLFAPPATTPQFAL